MYIRSLCNYKKSKLFVFNKSFVIIETAKILLKYHAVKIAPQYEDSKLRIDCIYTS